MLLLSNASKMARTLLNTDTNCLCFSRMMKSFLEDEEIESFLTDALQANDVSLAEAIVLEQYMNYTDGLLEKAFEIAEEVGCQEFIERNKRD